MNIKSVKSFIPSGEFLIKGGFLTNRETKHAILYGVSIQSDSIYLTIRL